jgi:hypothetical protein
MVLLGGIIVLNRHDWQQQCAQPITKAKMTPMVTQSIAPINSDVFFVPWQDRPRSQMQLYPLQMPYGSVDEFSETQPWGHEFDSNPNTNSGIHVIIKAKLLIERRIMVILPQIEYLW